MVSVGCNQRGLPRGEGRVNLPSKGYQRLRFLASRAAAAPPLILVIRYLARVKVAWFLRCSTTASIVGANCNTAACFEKENDHEPRQRLTQDRRKSRHRPDGCPLCESPSSTMPQKVTVRLSKSHQHSGHGAISSENQYPLIRSNVAPSHRTKPQAASAQSVITTMLARADKRPLVSIGICHFPKCSKKCMARLSVPMRQLNEILHHRLGSATLFCHNLHQIMDNA